MSIFDRKNLEELEREFEKAENVKITIGDDDVIYVNETMLGVMKKKDAESLRGLIAAAEEAI